MEKLFYLDSLSLIMMVLVGFVATVIASFSYRYLKGDKKQRAFYINLSVLVFVVFVMVSADHIFLLFLSCLISNFLLARLMRHKNQWKAAKESSLLAIRNFAIASVFLALSFSILYFATGKETSIQIILNSSIDYPWAIVSSCFLILAAMAQSGLWPFHLWLTSSLNSPTPVSAVMHAGLVNGGGFLLARFSPILFEQPIILGLIVIVGLVTAMLGTVWKLMQTDVKRMLACSTMGQMGFMVMQCGLGLFPAAVAHLCWHGFFKAYLFLASSAAAQEKRLDLDYPPSIGQFFLASICGVVGAYMFSLVSNKNILVADTNLLLIFLAMIAGTQFALPIIRSSTKIKLPLSAIVTLLSGTLYGGSVHLIERFMPSEMLEPQPLNALHIIASLALMAGWIFVLFAKRMMTDSYPDWLLKAYVFMLNASQPHPKTITAHRNHYQY